MKLYLQKLSVECIIGDLPRERVEKQTLELDIELDIPDRVSQSDDLRDTVDYAKLALDIAEALRAAKCRMIERSARIAAQVCLRDEKVSAAAVTVVKRGCVPSLGAAAARWEERR